ncbi:hypothetical protein E3E22_03465 [Thermococcus sp. MV5]|uniref:hypothetical protein n=1 Tax=Thermococcus sp. MV5 TaxID=1638272 RepID=UPI00143BBFA4|nr:hypothetical protein [Thermococcus sp. MV5]NJE25694.1 hypothetical protein [Thermococcus sp. MV5]
MDNNQKISVCKIPRIDELISSADEGAQVTKSFEVFASLHSIIDNFKVNNGGMLLMNRDTNKTDAFLKNTGIWEGEFTNYVNQAEGITQQGKIIIETEFRNGIVIQRNIFVRPDGTRSDYVGIARMRIEGNKLLWDGETEEDLNTGAKIRNHSFEGFVTDDQIYIFETYDEVLPNGVVERRRNTTHYYFLSETEAIMTANVYVNDELLVFASAKLRKIK